MGLRWGVKALQLLRQIRERGRDAGLKLCYRVRVIAPAHLAFASRENERLLGSKASFHRCFPHPLSKFLARKQQVPFGSGFCHTISSIFLRWHICATSLTKVATLLPSEK